jgi:hypothetical protein
VREDARISALPSPNQLYWTSLPSPVGVRKSWGLRINLRVFVTEEVAGWLVLVDLGEAVGVEEPVVSGVIIHFGDFDGENGSISFFSPERVIQIRGEGDTFTGMESDDCACVHIILSTVSDDLNVSIRYFFILGGIVELAEEITPPRLMISSILTEWK